MSTQHTPEPDEEMMALGMAHVAERLYKAEQHRDDLLEALLKYGEHRAHPKLCEMYRNPRKKVCTCGLDEAIYKASGHV